MNQKYEKLKTLLVELFQLDQPDLDFGLFRVLHAKSAEVSQFLDKDLLPQVKDAFALYRSADKAEIEKDLSKAMKQAQALGVDPEMVQKVKELRGRLESDAVDIGRWRARSTTTYSVFSAATTPRATSSPSASTSRVSMPSPTRARKSRSTGPTKTSITSRRASTYVTALSA